MATNLASIYRDAGREWDVHPDLLQAIAGQESGGTPNPDRALSPKGAQGRMQIMPATGQELGVTDPSDPRQSIYGGAKYYAQMRNRFKDPQLALAAYNAGPGRVDDFVAGKRPLPDETVAYVQGVGQKMKSTSQKAAVDNDPFSQALSAAQKGGAEPSDSDPFSQALKAAGSAAPAPAATEVSDPNARTGVQDDLGRNVPNIFAPQPPPKPAAPTINQPAPPIVGDHGEVLAPAAPDNTPVSAKPLAQAVATGAANGFGSAPIGMSDQTAQALRDAGVFPDPATGRGGPLRSINEAVIRPLATAGDLALRGGSAAFGAYQAGVAKLGDMLGAPVLGRDLAAMPEAFMGQPGGIGMPRANPLVPERGIVAERAPAAGIPAPEAALPAPAPTNALTAIPGGNAPAFVPPGANVPKLDRILELIRADDAVKASRPDFVPPDAVQPPNPLSTPAPRTVPAASTNALMPETAPPAVAPSLTSFLDSSWLKNAGEAGGSYDANKGAQALVGAVQAALSKGQPVSMMVDGGRKEVQITGIVNGMMQDASGHRWGTLPLALDGTGKEGVRIGGAAQPAPNSVGAAASAVGESNMSPAQTQAYRSVTEGQKLNEPQPVGRDTNRYVPGVEPTAASMEQSANVSREQKMLESAIPDDFKETAKFHNEARQEYFNGIAGSDVDVQNAKDARTDQGDRDLASAWRNKTDADASPVLSTARNILASPDGKRPLVRNAVASVTKELQDGDGLVTDPELLYGVRKHIDDLMSKEAAADDKKSVRAVANLQKMKTALDGVIEKAAPGFKQYLQNFSEASRPIDAMEALQKHENKLYDTQGRMQLSRVQGMMKNIVDSRASPGLNPYKSIPDETMEKLWALRDDLRRVASADELARAKGSDTAQNFMDMAKGAAKLGGSMVAHGAANAVAPVYGSLMLNAARGVMGNVKAASAEKKMRQRAANMLHPDPAKYPPPSNALLP